VTGSFIRCKGSSLLIVFGGTVWLLPARHLYVCCLCAPVVCELLLGDTGIVLELPDQRLEDCRFKLLSHDDFPNACIRCSVKCL
jgi:hypothetical protein